MNDKIKTDSSYRRLWKYHVSGILIGAILGGLIGYLTEGSGSAVLAWTIVLGFAGEFVGLLIGRALT
jgi:uncharacterized protein YcfJ